MITIALCVASYVLYAALLLTFPLRLKNMQNSAGKLVLSLKQKTSKSYIAIFVIAPVIITLILLLSFPLTTQIVICACSVLAVHIVVKELLSRKIAGVYENALIFDGKHILLSDILSLPTLAYEEDASVCTLKIVTKQEGEFFITFATSEERQNTVQCLLSLNPALKPE
mgnify:FL=1